MRILIGTIAILTTGCAAKQPPPPDPDRQAAPPGATAKAPPPGTAAAAPERRSRLLHPREIIERLEKSDRSYRVEEAGAPTEATLRRYAHAMYPPRQQEISCPAVTVEQGRRRLHQCPRHPAAQQVMDEGEVRFRAKDYLGAEKLYAQAVALAPDDYLANLFLGDGAFFRGEHALALERYERASALNPADHLSWFFRGNALAELGRKEEALRMYARALALNPRNFILRTGVEARERALGFRFRPDFFRPKAMVEVAEDEVVITTPIATHWIAWSMCKALWLGEPGYRQERTGSTRESFTDLQERECLGSLLAAYASAREDGTAEAEPELDRLLRIVQAGKIGEYILFDLATRVAPHATLTLPDAQREQLEAFVLEEVFLRP